MSSSSYTIEDIKVPDDTRELLETYSGIPSDWVLSHVLDLREKAYKIFPYPCIGQFKFLDLTLNGHPLYTELLKRLQGGQKLLDFGCCFAQDLRKMVADGAPSENIDGLDVEGRFIEMGYDFFLDRDKLQSRFVVKDVFASDTETDWSELREQYDIIHASAFFHLYNWDKQIASAKRMIQLIRPQKGSIIVGRQMGSLTPCEFPNAQGNSTGYRHDLTTLSKLWGEIGQQTGTSWQVEGTLDMVGVPIRAIGKGNPSWAEPNRRRLLFTITRE